jgi:GH25 family lysozyme M1 (1,4-beta-N-acetylmuramidase)
MSTMISGLKSCSAWSGRVWLDIEGSQYWLGSSDSNRQWYQDLVDACKSKAHSCGVYSSASQWSAIFGSGSYAYGSNLPLWYAHYDGNPSFSDFSSFGGWSSPHVKQYKGDVSDCSMGIDENYSPNF